MTRHTQPAKTLPFLPVKISLPLPQQPPPEIALAAGRKPRKSNRERM